jgi:hypothetical protein
VKFMHSLVQAIQLPRVAVAPCLALAIAAVTGMPAVAQDIRGLPHIVFTVDIAEDAELFDPTFVRPTDTQPERGSFFVTEGNIFPGHTIQGDGATFDPNSAGALGRWFCRGTHLVSGAEFPFAARGVHTAQLYLLPDEDRSIATEGLEGNATVTRAVSGGTGLFRGYVGEQKQEFLGFNASGGVNLRVTFTLRRVAH